MSSSRPKSAGSSARSQSQTDRPLAAEARRGFRGERSSASGVPSVVLGLASASGRSPHAGSGGPSPGLASRSGEARIGFLGGRPPRWRQGAGEARLRGAPGGRPPGKHGEGESTAKLAAGQRAQLSQSRAQCARRSASMSNSMAISAVTSNGTPSCGWLWCTCARACLQAAQRPSTTGPAQCAQIRCSQLIRLPFGRPGAPVSSAMLDLRWEFPP